jgi:transposase
MSLCILDHAGDTLLPRTMPATPEALLKAITPSRDQVVLAAACMFTWYWLADLWADHGIPCVRGHALYLKAIHGGKAKNDKIDAHKIAVLLRGGMLPQASVYPAARRATRDLLRRRMPLARQRGALLAHVHNPNSQYHLPALGKKSADTANRDGGAERCADPAVQTSLAVDLALSTSDDALLRDVERTIVKTATHHDAQTLSLLQTVPGIGQLRRLVRRYEMHHSERCPRGQDFASYGRLVKCATASAGKRSGTSGSKLGKAPLTWAFAAAAVFFLRENPAAQQCLARLEHNHSTGNALTILAHPLARAVYDRLGDFRKRSCYVRVGMRR